MNKLITIIAVIVIIVGGWMLFKGGEVVEDASTTPKDESMMSTSTSDVGSDTDPNIKEFTVDGSPFVFVPNSMTVNLGDTVKITFVNKMGLHDLVIDQFNVRTAQIPAGQSETVTFVADKAGTFEYYCSVGTHRQQGMVGTLTVI